VAFAATVLSGMRRLTPLVRTKKKRPAPEGTGLPGVVSSDIVNWEGNYILDTNTFLIVIMSPFPLAHFPARASFFGASPFLWS
jgi:hypothetical protein